MKFTAVVSSFVVATASAVTIRSDSEAGQNLLSKARELKNNNNNYYYSWIKDYSIKFDGCAAVPQMEREEGVRSNLLAKFKLCPSDKCGSCPNAGEYVVDMREFVETYQEAKKAANEAACETAEYNCEYACENGQYEYNENYYYYDADGNGNNKNDGEYCKYQCLSDGGYGFCAQDDQQEGEMNMNEFAECRPMNEDEANNNGYYYGQEAAQIYYLGARCTTSGVYAAVFTDSACTKVAPSGTYEKYNYGYSLPSEPMVEPGCTSCAAVYDDDNNNGYYPNEFCEGLYEQAARCEKKVKGTSYQDNSSCELIHTVIPKLSSALKGLNGGISWAKFFAWTFFIVIAGLAWYIYRLHKIVIRQKVNLGTLMMGTPAEGQAA